MFVEVVDNYIESIFQLLKRPICTKRVIYVLDHLKKEMFT